MNAQDPPSKPRGLLSGAAWSYLTTDGGGGDTTDGGGGGTTDGGGHRRSTVVAEAIRRSQSGIVRTDDTIDPPAIAARPGKGAAAAAPGPLVRWDSWVKSDLVMARLLSKVRFGGGSVLHAGDAGTGAFTIYTATAPGEAVLQAQAETVKRRARFREDRFAEIEVQVDQLWPFWDAILHLNVRSAPRTHELLHAALLFASSVVLQIKHDLAVPRPSRVSPLVMPILDVPGHGALPSGHATAAYALSGLVVRLLGLKRTGAHLMQRLAYRVAYNREVAGLHYPMDSLAGRLLGETLAAYVQALAGADAQEFAIEDARFDGAALDETLATELSRDTQDLPAAEASTVVRPPGPRPAPAADPVLAELWALARAELQAIGRWG